ncbi:MAG: DUF434 domain-containing protein [Phycisphaerae bacterium]
MPDKRRHRGKHPEDDQLFAPVRHEALRTAVAEYSWLLTRGYATGSALKLVGDRYNLTARQRMAVRRSSCSDQSLEHRAATMTPPTETAGQLVGIDGYNLLITIESALAGGLILVGRDGCHRDLASVHGTYRKVDETVPAVTLIVDFLATLNIRHIDWYLDRPVSNSGRLKALMAEVIAGRTDRSTRRATWNIELVNSPDALLVSYPHPVVSSDSVILDQCTAWLNLAEIVIDARIPTAWKVDLR